MIFCAGPDVSVLVPAKHGRYSSKSFSMQSIQEGHQIARHQPFKECTHICRASTWSNSCAAKSGLFCSILICSGLVNSTRLDLDQECSCTSLVYFAPAFSISEGAGPNSGSMGGALATQTTMIMSNRIECNSQSGQPSLTQPPIISCTEP